MKKSVCSIWISTFVLLGFQNGLKAQYTITTIAGNGQSVNSGDNGLATNAGLTPASIAVDKFGNLFIADSTLNTVRKVDTSGIITTIACGGTTPLGTLPLPAHTAQCGPLAGIAVDNSGNVFLAEGAHNVDWLDSSGTLHKLTSQLSFPQNVALDSAGNVYAADLRNCRIVKLDQSGNLITVAGMSGICGFTGDNGPATNAQLSSPTGVAVDSAGNIYIADINGQRVRKVNTSGTITNVAGNAGGCVAGPDGVPATSSPLCPEAVAVDAGGNLYIAEVLGSTNSGYGRIRKVDATGIITTIAGGGSNGLGDNGPATSAQLAFTAQVVVDPSGLIYIADAGNNRVRLLRPNQAISITNLSPASATAGGPAFTLTVSGAGFAAASTVRWNGSSLVTNPISANQLTAAVPASLIAAAGIAGITVLNSGGPASNPVSFAINPASSNGLSIITASPLPPGTVGKPYSEALAATGGVAPYKSWSVTAGSLPPDMSLTSIGGVLTALLTGVPTTPGSFGFTVQVTDSANASATKQFSFTIGGSGAVSISANGIANAASFRTGPIAPGEIITIFGSGLGPTTAASFTVNGNGYVPTSLAGTQVLFDGAPAPVIFSQSGQVSVVVPYAVAGKASTLVQAVYQSLNSNAVAMQVRADAPGIFTADGSGNGAGAILNQDGTLNSAGNPATAGSILSIFATGEGQTVPIGVDGKPDDSPAPLPLAAVRVTIGGANAQVLYAGGVPGLVAGVLQINVQLPAGGVIGGNSVPVALFINGDSSQVVTLALR